MAVKKESFREWTNRLPEIAMGLNSLQHPVAKVPAPIFTMRYGHDVQYMSEDEALELESVQVLVKIMRTSKGLSPGPPFCIQFVQDSRS